MLLLVVGSVADVTPTWEWVNKQGSVTFNGAPAPVGTVIDAYDPDGVHCGTFTVGDVVDSAGIYGLMPVYRDDPYPPNDTTDEGADPGDTITFKVNGRDAVAVGDVIWGASGDIDTVDLSVTGTVLISGVDYPADKIGAPDDTVRFLVGVRNDGDGLDYYSITASSGNGWTVINQDTFTYANVSDTVYIYFDVVIPTWPGTDTIDVITYSVFSQLDTSQHVDSSVTLVASVSTGVHEDVFTALPSEFSLNQNFPNPFNPTTTISYSLQSRSHVTLTVYNVLGSQVRAHDLGLLPAGEYSFEFDAGDLPSGVYFYRLETDFGVQTRKMMLLK